MNKNLLMNLHAKRNCQWSNFFFFSILIHVIFYGNYTLWVFSNSQYFQQLLK